MKNYLKYFDIGSFDIVISNPPFFKINENINFLNNLDQLSIARHEIEINLDSYEVYKNNSLIDLSTREFELLAYLMKNAGIVLSK